MDKKVAQHNEIKSSFDNLKSQGVTKELVQAVHAREHRRNPTEYKNISDMENEVIKYDQEQAEVLREQRQQQLALQRQEMKIDKGVKDMKL